MISNKKLIQVASRKGLMNETMGTGGLENETKTSARKSACM